MTSRSIFNSKYLLPIALLSSIAGGTIYGVAVIIVDDFNPFLSLLAGFAGCLGLVALEILGMKRGALSRDSAPISTILFYGIFGLFSLYIGSVFLYFYLNVGIENSIKPIEVLSFDMFIAGKIELLDIILSFLGATLASYIPSIVPSKFMDK